MSIGLSDLEIVDGKYNVEWTDEDGCRWRNTYNNKQDFEEAKQAYAKTKNEEFYGADKVYECKGCLEETEDASDLVGGLCNMCVALNNAHDHLDSMGY